jgi:hypothetical protein
MDRDAPTCVVGCRGCRQCAKTNGFRCEKRLRCSLQNNAHVSVVYSAKNAQQKLPVHECLWPVDEMRQHDEILRHIQGQRVQNQRQQSLLSRRSTNESAVCIEAAFTTNADPNMLGSALSGLVLAFHCCLPGKHAPCWMCAHPCCSRKSGL